MSYLIQKIKSIEHKTKARISISIVYYSNVWMYSGCVVSDDLDINDFFIDYYKLFLILGIKHWNTYFQKSENSKFKMCECEDIDKYSY